MIFISDVKLKEGVGYFIWLWFFLNFINIRPTRWVLKVKFLGPKSHEISLKDLSQIFYKSSYDPRRRYEAHRRRDIKKISLGVLFEILRRSSIKIFLRSSWDLKKIFWRFIIRLAEDFIRRSSEDLLSIFDYWQKNFKFF